MRHYIVMTSFFCLTLSLLSGCGNSNDGRALTPYKRKLASTVTTQTTTTGTTAPLVSLDYCKAFGALDNSSASALFNGAQVCKITGSPTSVRIKVSTNFPLNGRYCVIPMTANGAFRESCFSINGQADVALDPLVAQYGYGSMVMIAEGDIAAYRAFTNFQTTSAPPRGLAIMNQ